MMKSHPLAGALLLAASSVASAQTFLDADAAKQANSLISAYATFCVKHLSDLKRLSDGMQLAPAIPAEKAAPFLQGEKGTAWVIPDKSGTFVLAIHKDQPRCAVYAQRAGQEEAKRLFSSLITAGSGAVKVSKVEDKSEPIKGGTLNTMTYEWQAPGVKKKMVFSLTTADAPAVPLQAVVTAESVAK